mmetsp:Transcript_23776/g.71543  ORF Transcript_23776/g.71543 Transcript_23776/m.71543 type:complete len:380 (+) Transcript_23776:1043-2182(+)
MRILARRHLRDPRWREDVGRPGRSAGPRNIHVAAAAWPRPTSTERASTRRRLRRDLVRRRVRRAAPVARLDRLSRRGDHARGRPSPRSSLGPRPLAVARPRRAGRAARAPAPGARRRPTAAGLPSRRRAREPVRGLAATRAAPVKVAALPAALRRDASGGRRLRRRSRGNALSRLAAGPLRRRGRRERDTHRERRPGAGLYAFPPRAVPDDIRVTRLGRRRLRGRGRQNPTLRRRDGDAAADDSAPRSRVLGRPRGVGNRSTSGARDARGPRRIVTRQVRARDVRRPDVRAPSQRRRRRRGRRLARDRRRRGHQRPREGAGRSPGRGAGHGDGVRHGLRAARPGLVGRRGREQRRRRARRFLRRAARPLFFCRGGRRGF